MRRASRADASRRARWHHGDAEHGGDLASVPESVSQSRAHGPEPVGLADQADTTDDASLHLVPQIIDNIRKKLRPAQPETLEESTALDACMGYFNLRVWDALCEPADRLAASTGGRLFA